MEAFGVSSWEEVLAFFKKGSGEYLENRWGWLEILRRGEDGDVILSNPWESVSDLYKQAYRLRRDDAGRILVGDIDHAYFAQHQTRYTLVSERLSMPFTTPYPRMHWHISVEQHSITADDVTAIGLDGLSIVAETGGYVGITVMGPGSGGAGMALQAFIDTFGYYGAFESFGRLVQPKKHGGITSDEILGIAGAVPAAGIAIDFLDLISHASGWRTRISP